MSSQISLPRNLATDLVSDAAFTPAETQVTSAEILADAHDIKQTNYKKPSSTIQDLDELRSFQLTKRRDYEQQLNKNRLNYGQWIRYARWEIDHNRDFRRARSIFERALEVNVQHVPFWIRYIELELLHKNVNHARNLLDRAVTILPSTDKFWFIYVQTEETLGNYDGVRAVFERWLKWRPSEPAWESYISFEERYTEYDNARAIFVRYVVEFANAKTWKRWAVFETTVPSAEDQQIARIRGVFETALDTLLGSKDCTSDPEIASMVSLWVDWEASVNESERAAAIISTVLDRDFLSKEQKLSVLSKSAELKQTFEDSSDTVYAKKKLQLEKAIAGNIRDYDAWWEFVKLQESSLGAKYAISVLEKAVGTAPLDVLKSTVWRRYVFLWIKLALYKEYAAKDVAGAREAWTQGLKTVPHDKFTFAKLWTMFCEFELRNGESASLGLEKARKVLGQAIGQGCKTQPKRRILTYYMSLERRLGELDRVRRIYEKWLELCLIFDKQHPDVPPQCPEVLLEYIEFEKSLGESERCVALFEIGISDELGESPKIFELFIEYLREEFRYDRARQVFRAKAGSAAGMWIQFALFESSILSPGQMEQLESADSDEVSFSVEAYHVEQTRGIFTEAYSHFKASKDGASAALIVAAWVEYEKMHGTKEAAEKAEQKLPKAITKRRNVDGVEEVYQEYEFPEAVPNLSKFLAKAKQWASTTATI